MSSSTINQELDASATRAQNKRAKPNVPPSNIETRSRETPDVGHGLHEFIRRHDGNKMHIEFTAGVRRPKKVVRAAKLSSEVGFYTRSNMPIATHWKQ
jgi:hypothetical protein